MNLITFYKGFRIIYFVVYSYYHALPRLTAGTETKTLFTRHRVVHTCVHSLSRRWPTFRRYRNRGIFWYVHVARPK